LPWIEADWSAIGGEGGTSPAASAAAAGAVSPQLLQPPAQLLQALAEQQLLQVLQDFLHLNRPSRPPHFFLQQPLLQLLQLLQGSQQEGAASQQVGSQAASQQVGSQADWQQLFLHLWQSNRPPRPPNKWHFFLQQPLLQLLQGSQQDGAASQQVGSQAEAAQQEGSAPQQVGAASQHVGSAEQHDGSQQLLPPPPPP